MKIRSLLSLIVPLCALSACSYRGEVKPLRDGDFLIRDSFEIRNDTFEVVDQHFQAKDSFCLYFSLEGCSSCEKFLEGFKTVAQESKILTFHLEAPQKADDMTKLYEKYPELKSEYSPSFYVVNDGKIESIPYDQINSENRLRNTLKRKVSLVDNYFFGAPEVDFSLALEKAQLNEATLIELDFSNASQVSKYQTAKAETSGPLFVHQKAGLSDIQISKISK